MFILCYFAHFCLFSVLWVRFMVRRSNVGRCHILTVEF